MKFLCSVNYLYYYFIEYTIWFMQTFEYLTYSYIFFEYNIGIISLKFEKNCKSYINVLKMY